MHDPTTPFTASRQRASTATQAMQRCVLALSSWVGGRARKSRRREFAHHSRVDGTQHCKPVSALRGGLCWCPLSRLHEDRVPVRRRQGRPSCETTCSTLAGALGLRGREQDKDQRGRGSPFQDTKSGSPHVGLIGNDGI